MTDIDILNPVEASVAVIPATTQALPLQNAAIATKLDISALPELVNDLYIPVQSATQLVTILDPIADETKSNVINAATAFFDQLDASETHFLYIIYCKPQTDTSIAFVAEAVISAKTDIRVSGLSGSDFFGLAFDDFDTLFTFTTGTEDTDTTDYLYNLNALKTAFGSSGTFNVGQLFIWYQSSVNAQIALAAAGTDATPDTTSYYAKVGALNFDTNMWIANVLFPTDASQPISLSNRIDAAAMGYGTTISLATVAQFSYHGRTFEGVAGFQVKNVASWPFPYGNLNPTTSVNNIANGNNNVYETSSGQTSLALGRLNIERASVIDCVRPYIDNLLIESIQRVLDPLFRPAAIPFDEEGNTLVLGSIAEELKQLSLLGVISPSFSVVPNPEQSYDGAGGILGPYEVTFTVNGKVHAIMIAAREVA